jgi:hypothetical protein
MAKSTMDFAQQNTERAMQATNWMRAIAEQNLNQRKAAFEGLLTIVRNAVRSADRESSPICEQSIAAAEQSSQTRSTLLTRSFVSKTLRNSFNSRPTLLVGKLRSSASKPRSSGKG